MKKKILVLGSTGMLGHRVCHYFLATNQYEVTDIAFRRKLRPDTIVLNVCNQEILERAIVNINPDYIINCIGVISKDKNHIENAIYLNAYLPHQLKNFANRLHAKLIHISTDCVFSGIKGGYIESDDRDGRGIYAQTKILGEVNEHNHLTLRTSLIGPELKNNGSGLFHWFMSQQKSIEGYTKMIWSGVTTTELSKAIQWSINNEISGLYHITNGHPTSKNDLLELFKKYTKKEIRINAVDGKCLDKSLIDTRLLLDYQIPSYEKMISCMVDETARSKKFYSQYNLDPTSEK